MTDATTRNHRGQSYTVSEAHPAAAAFPWLPDDELQALADDIGTNGLLAPVKRLPDGRIIDGRNRELACLIAGVAVDYADVPDMSIEEAISFVLSRNNHRRHLTVSQRAMIGAELSNLSRGSNQYVKKVVNKDTDEIVNIREPSEENSENVGDLAEKADRPHEPSAFSQGEVAEQMDVSQRSVRRAARVKKAAPELAEPVKDGKLDVNTAAKAAALPKPKREKIAAAENPREEAKKQLEEEAEEVAEAEIDEGAEFVAVTESLCREIDQVVRRVKELKLSRYSYSMHLDSAVSQIEAARKTLWQGRPCHPCLYCRSEGCRACQSTGRLKAASYKSALESVGGGDQ